MKRYAKKQGFTLVELLIVIVVIGILSAMMMLSSTEAVSSARAADIVSDLTSLKTAALSFYVDNLDEIEKVENNNIFSGNDYDTYAARVFQYLNNDDKMRFSSGSQEDYKYSFGSSAEDGTKTWFVWCKVSDMKVRKKLESRSNTASLYGAGQPSSGTGNTPFSASDTTDHAYVGMKIK